MNIQLQEFARQTLKDGLKQLPHDWQNTFKLMYGRNNGKRSVEDAKLMPIESIVEEIPPDKLDWAMQQVKNSIEKLKPQQSTTNESPPLDLRLRR